MTYLTHLKTMLVQGLLLTFDEEYPEPDFRGVHCSIEYPIDKMAYPGIWVDYSDMDKLVIAGVAHQEYEADDTGLLRPYTRWKFTGYASYTITALTSLERDRLYDELVSVLAFGKEQPQRRRFRDYIETNDLIACNFDFDEIEPQGNTAAPGTPWGTDEIIYERTINVQVVGEFVSDAETGLLVPLSQVHIVGIPVSSDTVPFPYPTGDLVTDWH